MTQFNAEYADNLTGVLADHGEKKRYAGQPRELLRVILTKVNAETISLAEKYTSDEILASLEYLEANEKTRRVLVEKLRRLEQAASNIAGRIGTQLTTLGLPISVVTEQVNEALGLDPYCLSEDEIRGGVEHLAVHVRDIGLAQTLAIYRGEVEE